jgi:hypothetical protein
MFLAAAVLACLTGTPDVCAIYELPLPKVEGRTSSEMYFFDCLGFPGIIALREWSSSHPGMKILKGPICDLSNDPQRWKTIFGDKQKDA